LLLNLEEKTRRLLLAKRKRQGDIMASIFKRKRKVKLANGKTVVKQSLKYYTRLTDADGIKRTIPLFRDKTASQQRAAQLQKEIELARAGVVDRYKEHRKTSLIEHLKQYKASLLNKGTTDKQACLVYNRASAVIQGCGFVYFSDISASKVQAYLAERRRDGLGIRSSNYYLQAMKQFCRWLMADNRAAENPLAYLKGQNANTDIRHARRSLEPDEIRRLLEATAVAPKRYGMTGYERSLLYRFAAETGLRANEVRSLKVGDFDFDNRTVTVKAGYSKRRREDGQPLRLDTAALLQEFFKVKMKNAKAFGGTCKQLTKRTSDMIKADLAEAEIPYVDGAGRYADFHSLRHTTGSLLAASGVHPKVAQSIMRHSDINLTMSRYTHTLTGQEAQAVAGLPDLSLPSSQKQIATGTNDKSADVGQTGSKKLTPKLTPFLTPTAYPECTSPATVGNQVKNPSETGKSPNCLYEGDLGNEKDSLSPHDKKNRRGRDSNPRYRHYPYDGLANRCLKPLGHLSKFVFLKNTISHF
jgi:integrase